MKQKTVFAVLVLALVGLAGWALGQNAKAPAGAGEAVAASGGRFIVASSSDATVLLDTVKANSWVLARPASGRPCDAVWLPIRRIDERPGALKWAISEEAERKKRGGT